MVGTVYPLDLRTVIRSIGKGNIFKCTTPCDIMYLIINIADDGMPAVATII